MSLDPQVPPWIEASFLPAATPGGKNSHFRNCFETCSGSRSLASHPFKMDGVCNTLQLCFARSTTGVGRPVPKGIATCCTTGTPASPFPGKKRSAGRGISSQTLILRSLRRESDQFPRVVSIGGPLHVLVETPGIFALKGKPRFDWFCHCPSTSEYVIIIAATSNRFRQVPELTLSELPDPLITPEMQGVFASVNILPR